MKAILLSLTLFAVGCGCRTAGTYSFPLEPGEKIIFTTAERANQFRATSGNEPTNPVGGRVVRITEPVSLEY
jgi:hypothetical protein